MNAVTEINQNTALAAPGGYDPFAAYGAEAATGGAFLKFSKGEWQTGANSDEVPLGKHFVANMEELSIGWLRWKDRSPAERRMNLLLSGVKPDLREDLGHHDKDLWETDKEGRPQDPWSFTNELPLVDLDTGDQMAYAAASKGGIGCIGNLCKAFAKQRAANAGKMPVLELGRDNYMHSEWGKTYVPVLTIVDWVANGAIPIAALDGGDADTPSTEKPAATVTTAAGKTRF